jgi:hypothetical protein
MLTRWKMGRRQRSIDRVLRMVVYSSSLGELSNISSATSLTRTYMVYSTVQEDWTVVPLSVSIRNSLTPKGEL